MAVRNDVTVDFSLSPRVATVASPSTTISIQDLYDTLMSIQDDVSNLAYPVLLTAGGKDDLGGGARVGITLKLRNTRLAFEARPGPSYVQCTVTGGNLVAIDGSGNSINAINTTAFTQIVVQQSTSPTLVSTGIKKNEGLNNFEFVMRNSSGVPTTGLTVSGQRSIDGGAFASLANSVAEVGNGVYKINLAAADLNGDVISLRFTASGAADTIITVLTSR